MTKSKEEKKAKALDPEEKNDERLNGREQLSLQSCTPGKVQDSA